MRSREACSDAVNVSAVVTPSVEEWSAEPLSVKSHGLGL